MESSVKMYLQAKIGEGIEYKFSCRPHALTPPPGLLFVIREPNKGRDTLR